MRRYGYIVGIAIVLIAPLLARWLLVAPSGAADASSAKAVPSTQRLVIITPNNQDIRNEFAAAFSDWHQAKFGSPATLEFLTPGGTNDIERQLETSYREITKMNGGAMPPEDQIHLGIDLVWGGGDFFFNQQLKPLGILRPLGIDQNLITAAFPQPTLAGVKLYDQDKDAKGNTLPPRWAGTCLSSFGIVYNPDIYQSMGLPPPKTWRDLTDPKLFASISLADPTHSASVAVAYMMILQRAMADAEAAYFNLPENRGIAAADLKKTPAYQKALDAGWDDGMRELVIIAANARYFTDSSSEIPNDVAAGNAAVGMAIDFYGISTSQIVGANRATFVAPAGATAITPDPIAILYGVHGAQLELAQQFVEFILSPQGQRLWILKAGAPGGPRVRALFRPPIRQDVYADQTNWVYHANYFAEANGFNQRGEWMGPFTDLRMIWAAAWIDSRDDLRDAAEKILAIPDAGRREKLLRELSDIGAGRQETIAYGAARKAVESDPNQDADLWNARERILWDQRFAKHYREVAAETGQ
jgi:ABC-type Fe3+ transport system substrate-binding protein